MTLIYRIADPDTGRPIHAVERDGRFRRLSTPFGQLIEAVAGSADLQLGADAGPCDEAAVLAPTAPSKVVCVGLNYRHHADEMDKTIPDEPLMFMKPPTAVIGPDQPIELPTQSDLVHHEAELAVVVGRRAKNLERRESSAVIVGYTIANDVTARDIQRREHRYTRAKGFDTFCPLGPALASADDFSPADHRIVCRVDGDRRQRSRLDDFIFSVDQVVAFVSRVMTLHAGDVILTGTPAGVGPLQDGQQVTVDIDGIGTLRSPVATADDDI